MKEKQDLELLSKLAASIAEISNNGCTAATKMEMASRGGGYLQKMMGTTD